MMWPLGQGPLQNREYCSNYGTGTPAKQGILYTATKLPLMYSFSGNSAASAPISTFMCLWVIYVVLGSVYCTYFLQQNRQTHQGIYKSLTDACMWKLGLRPRYSFSWNIWFKISVFCLCSVVIMGQGPLQNREYCSNYGTGTPAKQGIL